VQKRTIALDLQEELEKRRICISRPEEDEPKDDAEADTEPEPIKTKIKIKVGRRMVLKR
jgi:hypothetical protein